MEKMIKYIEHVKLYGNEVFITENNFYFDLNSAIESGSKVIHIVRPQSSDKMPKSFNGTVTDTFNLSKYAKVRRIEITPSRKTIDFESFDLYVSKDVSYTFVFDYSFMFDNELESIKNGDIVQYGKGKYEAWIYPLYYKYQNAIWTNNRKEFLNSRYDTESVFALYQLTSIKNSYKIKDDIPMYKLKSSK